MLEKVNNDKMFHHAAVQHIPIHKHLSYLNTRASNFHLLQPAQRPPTHGTCCTVKHHLNKQQLETKFGARPTGSKGHCFYLNPWCFLSMGSQRVGRDWATELNWTELNWMFPLDKAQANSGTYTHRDTPLALF